jgi:dihydrofolate reductase
MKRNISLYIAMSLDGYIAKTDNSLDFLSVVERPNEDYGYQDFLQNMDTIIWGRKTFDKVLSFGGGIPHSDKSVYVLSKNKTGQEGHAQYVDDVKILIHRLQEQEGKNIYCDGGAELVFELLKHKLIDTLIVSMIPHLLGAGIRLFKDDCPEQNLLFKKSISYPSGLVQLWYDVAKTP